MLVLLAPEELGPNPAENEKEGKETAGSRFDAQPDFHDGSYRLHIILGNRVGIRTMRPGEQINFQDMVNSTDIDDKRRNILQKYSGYHIEYYKDKPGLMPNGSMLKDKKEANKEKGTWIS